MKSGEIKFYVDGKECPDTGGVGVDAIGGVFNCGLWGQTFEAVCTTVCSPYFAVNEVKLWRKTALSASALSIHYMLAGGAYPNNSYSCDYPEKVYKVGSYIDPNGKDE